MIEVKHLTKYYGEHLAVDDLSFEIPDGHVYGFLGPNGAGKSTTMNIMTGCLSATEGQVLLDGHDIFEEPKEVKKKIGYLPEMPPLYVNETPRDYLEFVGRAKGIRGAELAEQIEKAMTKTGIEHVMHRRIATLSKGYKQRVGIAQALLGDPEVVILDEPTVGLDPLQILEIRELIRKLGEDRTVIFSSHILSEVQAICDEIIMISNGRLVAFDTPENLEKNQISRRELRITTKASEEAVREILESCPEFSEYSFLSSGEDDYRKLRLKTDLQDTDELTEKLFFAFAEKKFSLLEMNWKKADLEEVFIELADRSSEEDSGADSENPQEEDMEPEEELREEGYTEPEDQLQKEEDKS